MSNGTGMSRVRAAFLSAATLCGALLAASPAAAEEIHAVVERTVAPGERAIVRVRSDAAGPVALLVYRVEEPLPLLDSGLDLGRGEEVAARLAASIARARAAAPERLRGGQAPAPGKDAIQARLSFVTSATATVPTAGATVETDVTLPSAGLYLVEVRGAEVSAVVAALSSKLALVTKRHPEGCLAWAVDRTTGRALANVVVEARAAGKPIAAATTDERGVAPLVFRRAGTYEVRALLGDDLAFGADSYVAAAAEGRRVYAFPHQPVYRPGERVEVKGVVRLLRDGRHVLDPEATEAVVRFEAPGGRELGVATAPVSADLGTFSAGLVLPKDAPTGLCAVVADVGGRSYEAPFRIEEYRRPTFEVTASAASPRALAGDEVAYDVSASYYEGGPVALAPLQWSLVFQRVDRELFPTDELVRLFFGTEREAYAPTVAGQGSATLDAAGRARVVVRAPPVREEGRLILVATVTAPDRTAVAGSGSTALLVSPLAVAIRTDRHLYGAEGVARVTVRATLADGSPAAGREGVLASALSSEGKEGLPEEREPETHPFTTDEQGVAALDVPFAQNGRHALSVAMPRAASEPPGPPAHATLHVWVVGEHADVGFSGDRVEIVADKDSYAPGDRARLLVLSPVGARPALFCGEGTRLDTVSVVPLEGTDEAGGAAVVEVPVTEEHAPNVFFGACVVDRGNLMTATRMLRVPPAASLLRAQVVPGRTELEPGESVPVTIRVTDAAGRPAAGVEVSLAVVDDALFGLHPDPAAPIEAFFHPLRRNDVRTGGPLHLLSVGFERRAPPAPANGAAAEEAEGGHVSARGGAVAPTAEPAPPSPRPARGLLRESLADAEKSDGTEGPLTPRADFRASVAWIPGARTGTDGTVAVDPVRLSDSLTRWRFSVRAVDAETRVGSAEATVRARKSLTTRVTLPRFLRAGDRVEAPWISRNSSEGETEVDAVAMATGVSIVGPNRVSERLAAGALVARDLSLQATRAGSGVVTAEARSRAGNDAVRAEIPVLPQGVPRTISSHAEVPVGGGSLPVLTLPPSAERGTARLRITVAPSHAHAVGAALPYLAGYPHGCTEQTMSRFYPAAVARRAMERVDAPPRGVLAEVPAMVDAGFRRLTALQHQDGGFGWWERDASDAGMTAYVLHGLETAGVAGAIAPVRDRAATWLASRVLDAGLDPATLAFACLALAEAGRLPEGALPASTKEAGAESSPLARAHLLKAGLLAGAPKEDAAAHVQDLLARAERGPSGVHWRGGPSARPERWTEDDVEATAWVLWCAGDLFPGDVVEDGARWLLAQRTGDRWRSTRATAACVSFLTAHVGRTAAAEGERSVAVSMNGLTLGRLAFRPEDAFGQSGVLEVDDADLPKVPVRIAVIPEGSGVWATASLSFTETGPAIGASANGFVVRRRFFRLEARPGPNGVVHVPVPWAETVPSGTIVESEVVVVTETDREFVMVTDLHAAGFEPERDVALSIEGRAPAPEADHVDRRDDRTTFFVRRMPAGTHLFRHRLRATHAGQFTALPAQAELMYFPDVSGSSAGESVEVSKAGEAGR